MRPKKLQILATLIILTLLSGCSYFNAFYNTKRYYKDAEIAREKMTDPTGNPPSEYEKSIEAGGRLIEFYPGSKYIEEALLIMGKAYYWDREYHKAQRKFRELQSNYPESEYFDESRLWFGKTLVALKQRQEATSMLRGLMADTNVPELNSGALFSLAELYYVDSLFVKAEDEFYNVTQVAEDQKIVGESYWRAGESAFRVNRYESALKHFNTAQNYELTRSLKFRTNFYAGRCEMILENYDEAIKIFKALINDNRYNDDHGKVYVQLGIALSKIDRIEDAFEKFEKTNNNYKRTEESAQAYYEKGMILLDMPDEKENAVEAFGKARIEKSKSLYALKADTMARRIDRVDNLRLNRIRTLDKIDFTTKWIENPSDPGDTSIFYQTEYYDSLAIDSLKLKLLWSKAYRDSVVIPIDTTTAVITDSTLVDSTIILESDTLSSLPTDSLTIQDTLIENMIGDINSNSSLLSRSIRPDSLSNSNRGFPDSLRVENGFDVRNRDNMSSQIPGMISPYDQNQSGIPMMPPGLSSQMSMPPGTVEDAFGQSVSPRDEETSFTAESENEYEIIRLFDPKPVLDSLAYMRSKLKDIRFQLGEVLLFDMFRTDSAKTIFYELANPPNVDSVRARALLTLSSIALQELDTLKSDSLIEVLANNYYSTKYGVYASEKIGKEIIELEKPDEIAFYEAERLYMDDENYQDAYSRYRWLVETFPASKYAAASMYASAFISGSKLDDPETAEELLNRLISEYPNTDQSIKAGNLIAARQRSLQKESGGEEVDLASEFSDYDALSEDELDSKPEIIGGVEALGSILAAKNLLPQEIIQGTGGEVVLRYIVDAQGSATNFRVVLEDPPGRGLGRALTSGLEEVTFRPGKKDNENVIVRVERTFTLPLDAPPNVRPLPRRSR
jgi:tetratricopeptide (TPR) repeat protein